MGGPAKVQRTWNQDPDTADAWKRGRTGVPYIDACQRDLQKTGWLAYKGRKTSAHFLIFDMWMDWRIGAFHDEECLFDYDFAMNYGNWAVVAKIGNGGSAAWSGSRNFDPEHIFVDGYRSSKMWMTNTFTRHGSCQSRKWRHAGACWE